MQDNPAVPSNPPVEQPKQSETPGPSGNHSTAPSGSAPPATAMEALQQRLEKYQETALKAKEEGNGSKARRMGRIVKVRKKLIPTKMFASMKKILLLLLL